MVLTSDDPDAHRKSCDICSEKKNVLIRCQYDQTGVWHLICVGKCWQNVSGGKDDGDSQHPDYRYGGMWKNKYADVTAKKPQKVKDRQRKETDSVREPQDESMTSDKISTSQTEPSEMAEVNDLIRGISNDTDDT